MIPMRSFAGCWFLRCAHFSQLRALVITFSVAIVTNIIGSWWWWDSWIQYMQCCWSLGVNHGVHYGNCSGGNLFVYCAYSCKGKLTKVLVRESPHWLFY